MIKLTIDNKEISAPEGTTVFEAARIAGIEIPHFCYHPRLSIAGNCRLCLVEVEGAKNPVISCKETVREGMIVRTESEVIRKSRADVLEFVLLNHPLDCPICDQAGECKLQDYYFKYSLKASRLRDEKVRKPKAQVIGPHVILDAERCVECARCVRFCEEIAGAHEIGLFERGDHTTIGVLEGTKLANPYSLCTVDICPVGALTSIDFRFKKRVWFLKSTPSICLGCATGCNIWIDHADSVVYRFRPRENESVNKSWMCDAGRMTYKELNAKNRALTPLIMRDGETVASTWDEAATRITELVRDAKRSEVVGVLSARASVEENTAFMEMCLKNFKAARLVWSGAGSDPQFEDKILCSADRNPNTAGVQKITKERVANLKAGAGYVILDGLSNKDLLAVTESRPSWVVIVTSRPPEGGGRWADVILPKATHAEQDGTFVNKNGIEQRAEKAFDPLGNSLPVDEIARRIAKEIP